MFCQNRTFIVFFRYSLILGCIKIDFITQDLSRPEISLVFRWVISHNIHGVSFISKINITDMLEI